MKALDGPAEGTILMLRRAPRYLRLVRDDAGKWDALDQLDDTPKPDEQVYAYPSVPGTWNVVFVRPGGRYEVADYRVCVEQPSERELRDTAAWQAWAVAQG